MGLTANKANYANKKYLRKIMSKTGKVIEEYKETIYIKKVKSAEGARILTHGSYIDGDSTEKKLVIMMQEDGSYIFCFDGEKSGCYKIDFIELLEKVVLITRKNKRRGI